ncbi:DUF5672 family protein [Thalassospira sp. A3_1]|uniref:DUF5672 family protein n=1 Tax=Thalassospira sp. A3_1 TaxID=2821088 RepID=UPI001ADD07BF|nr:DUF5672 family protein [Thalassospira sp. A3_1]MBO9506224.1 glycosyltransferase [Thalassospira sp. A3_1]
MRGYDKWGSYLPFYRQIMKDVRPGSIYLEIGVQNMGWPAALDPSGLFTRCVACDINPAIAENVEGTRFTDIIVGDATSQEAFEKIRDLNLQFDLIVDDASHTQHDILATFMKYWPLLRDGGDFVIEDTHADFSGVFAGGNYFGVSVYNFFGALAAQPTLNCFDPIVRRKNLAYRTMRRFYSTAYCDSIIESIKSLSFVNSCILIKKGSPSLGERTLTDGDWPIKPEDNGDPNILNVLGSLMDKSAPELAVVYLNRAKTKEERDSCERFIKAYQRFYPSVPHEFYVVNKGFSVNELSEQYMLFKDLLPRFINVNDEGLDLEAYRKAAIQIEEQTVFFMNTHSEPLQHGWLDKLYSAFTSGNDVGLVGCSGNMETRYPFTEGFPDFPNFHVRSNGFMISRQDYLDLLAERPLENKMKAYQFESGYQSMTSVIEASGRQALVVGRKGPVRPGALWRAGIFRSGKQQNLLLADNRTRAYQSASVFRKLVFWASSYSYLGFIYPLPRLLARLKHRPIRRFFRDQLKRVSFSKSPMLKEFSIDREVSHSRLVVVVPTHLEELNDDLAVVLLHNATKLKAYPLEVVLPETCSPSWYEEFFAKHGINGKVRLVEAGYFGSPEAVNKMGTDPNFYRMYREFEYLLICHLDAWIFQNRLDEWMAEGYDFVGAPLFLPEKGKEHFVKRMAPFGFNGGLSLRRVDTCIHILENFQAGRSFEHITRAVWFFVRNGRWKFVKILYSLLRELSQDWRGTCEKYNIYEDIFFTVIAPLCGNRIHLPERHVAMKFCGEVNYPLLQKEFLLLNPPVGIHGYDKYIDSAYLSHVQRFFERKKIYYDVKVLPASPLVSVVMIVKDLIKCGRIETFDQALKSVIGQSYEHVEIVLLDGASTDGTFQELQERYAHLTQIAFHCKADSDVWEGMANGVDLANGDLIAFMNSDDYFCNPKALELMVSRIAETDADMAFGGAELLTEKGMMHFPTHLPSVLNCFGIVHQATLIRKSVIETIDPFRSGHVTAENYLFVAILMTGFKVVEVPEILVSYRLGGVSSELYGGVNFERTIADFTVYMKKVTTIGHYLRDDEIRLLHGFIGVSEEGVIPFVRIILKIRDKRLRRLFLSAAWHFIYRKATLAEMVRFRAAWSLLKRETSPATIKFRVARFLSKFKLGRLMLKGAKKFCSPAQK